MKKISTGQFIERSVELFGHRYDYADTIYTGKDTNVTLRCIKHNETFMQSPANHYKGKQTCSQCKKESAATLTTATKLKNQELYKDKAKEVHGDVYDYSKVEPHKAIDLITIVCKHHGEFSQEARVHLKGHGCPKCSHRSYAKTKEEFIEEAQGVHGMAYDYSHVVYLGNKVPVSIVCAKHGTFTQAPIFHINKAYGCPVCNSETQRYGFDGSKPAILYYLSILGGTAYKIGITNRTVIERFTSSELADIEIINEVRYQNGREARSAEQYILKEFSHAKWDGEALLSSGNTELFKYDILGLDNGE